MKLHFLLILVFYFSSCAQEQIEPNMPSDNYLLKITQEWSRSSELQNLQNKSIGADDIEIRVWSGYGLRGTKSIVLQRSNDVWTGLKAEVESCVVLLPDSVDTEAKISDYRKKLTLSDCNSFSKDASGQLLRVDSVKTSDLPQANIAALWGELKAEGILNLPSDIERAIIATDGHSYVIELKNGNAYRASVIDNPGKTVDADRQINAIVKLLDQRLGTSIDGKSW